MNRCNPALLLATSAALLVCQRSIGQTTIQLNASGPGKTFEGFGAVSAGASSRLLIDYPEPQRSEILDFLFKPNYGASLQHLKVEIGSDVNSTDGSEPSHMRNKTDHNYTRGYEWWLMKEARKRNPNIVLDTLAWGAPGWVGNGTFFSKDMADYVADFLQGAAKEGLNIDYTGAWNERRPDYAWVKLLGKTLDEHHIATKIVCCDLTPHSNMYSVLDAVQADPELNKAVDVIGVHYPGEIPGIAPAAVQESTRRFWSSEDQPNGGSGPFVWRDWSHGGRVLARHYNDNYIKARFTKTEIWSPITSYYDNLAAPNSGLMYANTPWSGNYDVQSTIWVTAHTTQFAAPGWRYLDRASGYLPQDSGSYVSLHSPSGKEGQEDWSVVLETVNANRPQHVTFLVGRNLQKHPVNIWQTNGTRTFERVATVPVTNGKVEYDFQPDSIYTVTTTTGQVRGTAVIPPSKAFPFPYNDDFEQVAPGRTAKYFSDQDGAFEATACTGRPGTCLEQQVTEKPIPWMPRPDPYTIAGDARWKDYEVSIDARLDKADTATVIGRIDSADVFSDRNAMYPSSYVLKVDAAGTWSLMSAQMKHVPIALAQGTGKPLQGWHTLALLFHGSTITALLDGKPLISVKDSAHAEGMVGFGSGWTKVQFDKVAVRN